jgi:hypothetical protein
MSMDAMRAWEEHSHAHGSAYIVGKQLAIWAQPGTNLMWAANPQIARACRLSVRHVQRALRSLELAGEIVRQPVSPGQRRVYLIDAKAAGQLPLFTARGDTRVIPPHDTTGLRGDTHVTPTEGQKGKDNTPPAPPRGGAHPPDLLRGMSRPRRRRRGLAVPVAPQPCPLPAAAAVARTLIEQRWSEIAERLEPLMTPAAFEIWLADAHLHALAPLTVAVDAERIAWIASRFEPLLHRAAGVPVSVVACQQLGVRA